MCSKEMQKQNKKPQTHKLNNIEKKKMNIPANNYIYIQSKLSGAIHNHCLHVENSHKQLL